MSKRLISSSNYVNGFGDFAFREQTSINIIFSGEGNNYVHGNGEFYGFFGYSAVSIHPHNILIAKEVKNELT